MTDKTDLISYGFELSESGAKDWQNRTSRNTIQNVCKICGAIIGYLTVHYCGFGEKLATIGGYVGSVVAEKAAIAVMDCYEYGMQQKTCRLCNKSFSVRNYEGERNNTICSRCVQGGRS